jgi:hypothetical protein
MIASALCSVWQNEPTYFEVKSAPFTHATTAGIPQTLPAPRLRQQLSREQWENLKPLIRRLYIEENRTFTYITDFLAKAHNFRPT